MAAAASNWNGFKGAAKRLDDIDLPRIGSRIGVGEDELHAFMDVEAAGSGFDALGRPKMLFEPHVFYRNLSGEKQKQAVKAKLAYPKWKNSYPKDSYPRLIQAILIDETAALKAASWGLTQILGENHAVVGYATVQQMVRAFMADEEHHLEAAVEFLIRKGIDDDLRAHRWEMVARVYNGPGKVKDYAPKLARAFAKWQKIPDTPWSNGPVAKKGAAAPVDKVVENVQTRLRDLGYPEVGNVDGRMGGKTEAAILAFRNDVGLPLVPKIDTDFLTALMIAKPREISPERLHATAADLAGAPSIDLAGTMKRVGLGILGASGVGGVVDGAAEGFDLDRAIGTMSKVQMVGEIISTISPWLIGGIAGGAVIYFAQKFIREQVVAYRQGRHV